MRFGIDPWPRRSGTHTQCDGAKRGIRLIPIGVMASLWIVVLAPTSEGQTLMEYVGTYTCT